MTMTADAKRFVEFARVTLPWTAMYDADLVDLIVELSVPDSFARMLFELGRHYERAESIYGDPFAGIKPQPKDTS